MKSETTAGDRETHDRLPLPNFYAEMKRRGKNLSNLQEFAKSINYLLTHKIETMEELLGRIGILSPETMFTY